jgi:glycosyltransferase involved in cell wall biosynthesis
MSMLSREAARDHVVMMARIKNEGRWIRRCMERTWEVAREVVIFDDGSTDDTEHEVLRSLGGITDDMLDEWLERRTISRRAVTLMSTPMGWIAEQHAPDGRRTLHYLHSPFARDVVRPLEQTNEIRDKNMLWSYVKARCRGDVILCLDGDEMLSRRLVHGFPSLITEMLQPEGADMMLFPFVYLWDRDDQRRVDGIYGYDADQIPRLRFPRLFTIARVLPTTLFQMCFAWVGNWGGFHCGSIPQECFRPGPYKWQDPASGRPPLRAITMGSIVHFGYLHEHDRRRKFEFYNRIDPNNDLEGGYRHIIGEPNVHAPGPVQLVPWEDE